MPEERNKTSNFIHTVRRLLPVVVFLLGVFAVGDLYANNTDISPELTDSLNIDSANAETAVSSESSSPWWLYSSFLIGLFLAFVTINKLRHEKTRLDTYNKSLEDALLKTTEEAKRYRGEVESVYASVHQGIFSIDKQGIIQPNYSAFLEEIFETRDIEGREAVDLLFPNECLTINQLFQVRQSVETIIGELEMNFDFNSHLLLREYTLKLKRGSTFVEKKLKLDWTPVVEENRTVNLIVSIRDMTELQKAKADAVSSADELDITRQLFGVTKSQFTSFESIAKKAISESRELLLLKTRANQRTVDALIQNMESIKSTAMVNHFRQVSDAALDILSIYIDIQRNDYLGWNKAQLNGDLDNLEAIVGKYSVIYERDHQSCELELPEDKQTGIWFDFELVDHLQNLLELGDLSSIESVVSTLESVYTERENGIWVNKSVLRNIRENLSSKNPDVLKQILITIQSEALEALLKEVLSTSSSVDKPNVTVNAPLVRIKRNAFSLVNKVFSEVVNDNIAKGLSMLPEINKVGRSDIAIYTTIENSVLQIHIKDSGCEIDREELFRSGIEGGLWEGKEMPTASQIAEVVFDKYCLGYSSDKSRVQMAEVKQALADRGGDVSLKLLEDSKEQSTMPFELVIQLPENCFYRTH